MTNHTQRVFLRHIQPTAGEKKMANAKAEQTDGGWKLVWKRE